MQEYQLILQRSNKFQSLPDDATREAIAGFLLEISDHQDFKHSLFTIMHCYPMIPVRDISSEQLIECSDRWNIRGSRIMFLRFLIYAVEHGFISDSRIGRFVDFKSVISAIGINSDNAIYIMTDNNYERFKASDLYKQIGDDYSANIYCFHIPDTVPSSDYRLGLIRLIDHIKYDSSASLLTKITLFRSVNEMCDFLFYAENSFTVENVLRYIRHYKRLAAAKYFSCHQLLLELMSYFYNHGFLHEPHLIALAKMNLAYAESLHYDQAVSILSSDHPEYWHGYSYTRNNGEVVRSVRYINCDVQTIREAICDFLGKYFVRSGDNVQNFCNEFSDSLNGIPVSSIDDLGFKTYKEQLNYFNHKHGRHHNLNTIVTSFYVYLSQSVNENLFEKDGVPSFILHRQSISAEIVNGYEVVKYNPIEDVPSADKWIFCYKKYNRDTYVRMLALDFTRIKSKIYRNWLKHYVWKADVAIYTKTHPFSILVFSLNYLHDIKTGAVLTIFSSRGKISTITVNNAMAYRNHVMASFDNNRTRSGYIYNCRNLLRHVADHNLGTVQNGVFYTLTHTLDQRYDNTAPIPNEHLNALAPLIKKKAEKDNIADIYSSIFFLALETEFRGSQIVDLNRNCIQETAKKNEYVVVSETKTSANEPVEQPVSLYVVKELQHVISITEPYREECTTTRLLNKLFIAPGQKKGTFIKIRQDHFNSFLRSCCSELGLPLYTLENLRDTRMTKAEEFKIRNKLSNMEQSVLTGHKSSSVDDIHYVKLDIREMLEAVHGVTIGNVDLEGHVFTVLDPSIANESNEVSNGCGYCKSEACTMLMNLDCPVCKDFATTIDRLPYFEEQVRLLDQKIMTAMVPHDKEDLVNIKRLFLRYIEEILKKKEALENAGD